MERRLKILHVRESLIIECLQPSENRRVISFPKMPEGTKIQHVSFDYMRNAFMLFLHHPSFDPVPEGEIIPLIDTEYIFKESWRNQPPLL